MEVVQHVYIVMWLNSSDLNTDAESMGPDFFSVFYAYNSRQVSKNQAFPWIESVTWLEFPSMICSLHG